MDWAKRYGVCKVCRKPFRKGGPENGGNRRHSICKACAKKRREVKRLESYIERTAGIAEKGDRQEQY